MYNTPTGPKITITPREDSYHRLPHDDVNNISEFPRRNENAIYHQSTYVYAPRVYAEQAVAIPPPPGYVHAQLDCIRLMATAERTAESPGKRVRTMPATGNRRWRRPGPGVRAEGSSSVWVFGRLGGEWRRWVRRVHGNRTSVRPCVYAALLVYCALVSSPKFLSVSRVRAKAARGKGCVRGWG